MRPLSPRICKLSAARSSSGSVRRKKDGDLEIAAPWKTLALNVPHFSRKMPVHRNGQRFPDFTPELATQPGLPFFFVAQTGGGPARRSHHRRDRGHALRIDLRRESGARL